MTDVSSAVWMRLDDVAALLSTVAVEDLGLPPCALNASRVLAPPRAETPPSASAVLSREWEVWAPRSLYPADAPPAGQPEIGPGGVGSIALRDGLRSLLQYHIEHAADSTS